MTLHRIERGEPSVTMGAYIAALAALGIELELVTRAKVNDTAPAQIRVADFPQLQRIAWQLDARTMLSPRDALSLYERNWRHVDKDALNKDERRLLRAIGGEHLLV